MKGEKVSLRIALTVISIFALINLSAASVEISDFFSDFTSSDATVNSSQDLEGKAVFELFSDGNIVESHDVPLKIKAGESVYKVILWEQKPQKDYYTAKVNVYDNNKLLVSRSYQVSYGTVALPNFHVVDFSPTNSGVQLLLRPFNPGAADIRIELLDNNDIVYTKTKEDMSLTTVSEIKLSWPFLLINNKNYIVRAKIYTHRLYASPLINTYIAYFKASQDIEILPDDVEVDEYGASVTIRGMSQVPFDGFITVNARNRETNEILTYRQKMEEILVSGKEDTTGVVWRGLVSGTYDVEITAITQDNVTVDKYETVLRIPESPMPATTTPVNKTPGFDHIIFSLMLIFAAWRAKGA